MQIQPLSSSDLPLACALCKEVFLAFDAPDYPRQGIDFFLSYIAPDHLHSMMRQGQLRLYGAFENNALSVVLALRGFSHISLLFVRADKHRQGFGRSLVDYARQKAHKAGKHQLTVNASPYAVPFYHAVGFCDIGSLTFQQGISYVPMCMPVSLEHEPIA